MYLAEVKIELQDYLFYASKEISDYYITSKYQHNYSLSYAFGFCPNRYEVYYDKVYYLEDLNNLNKVGIYIYPSKWDGNLVDLRFNSMKDGYALSMEKNTPFPVNGVISAIEPEAVLTTYILSNEKIEIKNIIRLGKWDTACRISYNWQQAKVIKANGMFEGVYNYMDLLQKPQEFDITELSIPNRLIQNAYYEEEIECIKSENGVVLPICKYFGSDVDELYRNYVEGKKNKKRK
ncbi:type I-D CRISPR-associated protein Cas5/Csc1 [Thermobrachium celere]|uniref:Uncharacterized protein n=1 Tax=Thermobrachium celere DSM 8682 TaxID=941824 RepID=R7RUS6_9CLOT|nr:type I-D CRISPR-associated protein Cas5/Csc1 [Thermobrachium celere]CDF59228.1 hypothetical protein TCEL_02296 [Thermobrachium celere DSM 8682]